MKRKHISPGVYYYETSLKNKKESFSRGYKKDIKSEAIEGSGEVLTFRRLKVTPPSINLKNGETSQLEVKFITEIHGVVVEELDVRTKCDYKSDNSNVIVDNEGNITAKKSGAHAVITVKYNNFTSKVGVSVVSEKTYELRINKSELQLNKNESEELIVKYYTITDGVSNEGVIVNDKCEWRSTDNEKLPVKNGKVTANASGVNGTITAIYKNKTVTCNVTVASELTNSFKVEPNYIYREYDIENPNNNIIEITATYTTITDGVSVSENVTTYSDCYWSCLDENISVEKGIITILDHDINNARVNVSYKGFNAYITVNVPAISVTTQTIEIAFANGYGSQFNSDESTKLIATLFTETDGVRDNGVDITNVCTWELSNNIDFQINKGVVTTNSFNMSTIVTAKYNGVTSNSITVTAIKVEEPIITYSLEITPETITLNIGDKQTMEVKYYTITDGLKDDGVNVTDKCTWIYDEQLFSINNGELSALTDDVTGVISATYHGITSNEVSVTVNKTEIQYTYELSIEPTEINTVKDEETEISVWLITKEGDNEISRISVTDNCTWELDDNITVENGKVIVTKGGVRGNITARYENMSATCSVTCADDYVYKLVAEPASIDIQLGQTILILLYENTYKNGELFSHQEVTGATWTTDSSHINVSNGTVKLNSFGENGSITAEYDGITITIPVTISPKIVQKLVITHPESEVSPPDVTISPNETTQFYAYLITEVNDVKESEIDVTSDCKWSSPDKNVNVYKGLAMSEKGNIIASINATYTNGENVMVANATLRTSDLIEYRLVIGPENVIMGIDDEQTFTATLHKLKNDEIIEETELQGEICLWSIIEEVENPDTEYGEIIYGVLKPSKSGETIRVQAVYNGIEDSMIKSNIVSVTILSSVEHKLVIESETITLDKDFTEPLSVRYQMISNGETIRDVDVTDQCTFSSKDSSIASVDENGVITTNTNGASTIIEVECFISNIERTLTAECEVIVNEENYPYMYIQTLENDTEISFSVNTLTYSMDGINWNNTLDPDTTISIKDPTRIYFKATGLEITNENGIGTFSVSKPFNAGGNIMSLILGDDYDSHLNGNFDTTLLKPYMFKGLFKNCTTLQRVSRNFLPLTKVPSYCYYETFSGCSSLKNTPELPNGIVHNGLFSNMFENCISLRVLPTMDITVGSLAFSDIYSSMFKGCTSVKDASNITINDAPNRTYTNMFEGCTSLKKGANILAEQLNMESCLGMYKNCSNLSYIKLLSTNISAKDCLKDWVYGVASKGTFVKHKDATWDVVGINGVPEGWEIVYEDANGVQTHETMVSGYITNGGVSTYSMRSAATGLSNVNVGVYGTTMATTTDENGYYEFPKTSENFDGGKLICYANGYEPQIVNINQTNSIDVSMEALSSEEEFDLQNSSTSVKVFEKNYSNYICIDVPNKTEEVTNEFIFTVNDEAKSWLAVLEAIEYKVPKDNGEIIEGGVPYIETGFQVEENKGKERVGYITITHTGGWKAVFTVSQEASLIPEDLPKDAFKDVEPNVTPWFTTQNSSAIFVDSNWGRAEKVLYVDNECKTPDGMVYVPGATEHTTLSYQITEYDENSSSKLSDWCEDYEYRGEWHDSSQYDNFKYYTINLGPKKAIYDSNITHRSVVVTFLVRNYNNTIGNYFAFSVRIVQCKQHITENEFKELVKQYGRSNYDGTMNDLTRFGFGEFPQPDMIEKGKTLYLTTFEREGDWYEPTLFGTCDRVLYMTYKNNMEPFKVVYPSDMNEYDIDYMLISCRDGSDNNINNYVSLGNQNNADIQSIGTLTDFIPVDTETHRVIDFNFKFKYFVEADGLPYKQFNIPYKIVQCKEGITKEEFKALVVKYGPSNYDGTMGKLDEFNF